jgi:hypothetical protein
MHIYAYLYESCVSVVALVDHDFFICTRALEHKSLSLIQPAERHEYLEKHDNIPIHDDICVTRSPICFLYTLVKLSCIWVSTCIEFCGFV